MIEANHQWKKHPDWAWTGDHLEGLKDFKPTWLEAQFQKKLPKSPQRIFVGSMSEIAHWERSWVEKVIDKIKEYPQHTFQFLTRHPEVYSYYIFPKNCWLGATITDNESLRSIYFISHLKNIKFISIEPILEYIEIKNLSHLDNISWVILGAETGNRKDKIIPDKRWLLYIIKYCDLYKIPIFIKDNLLKYYSKFDYMKEFPEVK